MEHKMSFQQENDGIDKEFREKVMEGKWEEVIEKYENDVHYHKKIIVGNGTALHMAANAELKDKVKRLVEAILNFGDYDSLEMVNDIGATPLHLAAYRGFTDVCQLIIGEKGERRYLIQKKNKDGETPLFWAVCGHKTFVFLYLQQFYRHDFNIAVRNYGTSILHIAIQREMFDLAVIIMHCYKGLIPINDKDGMNPLENLATKTSAFESGSRLPWWKQILYYCVTIVQDDANVILKWYIKNDKRKKNEDIDIEHHSQVDIPESESVTVRELEKKYGIKPSPKSIFDRLTLPVLDEIKTFKKKHKYGRLLFEAFMEKPLESYMNDGGVRESVSEFNLQEFTLSHGEKGVATLKQETHSNNLKTEVKDHVKETTYLIAASHGITEMLEEFQKKITNVIDETNTNNESALLLAVKNRQPYVIEKMKDVLLGGVFKNLVLQVDKNENTMLHLAAYTSSNKENTWRVSGDALQMMWNIKWYKYIKGLEETQTERPQVKSLRSTTEDFEKAVLAG